MGVRLNSAHPRGSGDPVLWPRSWPQFLIRNLFVQITPAWIHLLDQLRFPFSIPFLDLPLAGEGGLSRIVHLVPNQDLDAVVLCEAWQGFFPVHPYALGEIVSHADVQRPVPLTCEDV